MSLVARFASPFSSPLTKKKMKKSYSGHTLAYHRFERSMWKTEMLLQLGVAGIDDKIEKTFSDLQKKFEGIRGVPGRRPKNYEPKIKSFKSDSGEYVLELDVRSATLIKRALEFDKIRHDNLRFFLYSNIFMSVWASFETYNQMLFEELLTLKPEMLKTKEVVTIENIISNRTDVVSYLIERQIDLIGRFKINDLLEYLKSKINYSPSMESKEKLIGYYFVRNIIAHKSGIVRPSQKKQLPQGIKCVEDELQISESFLKATIAEIQLIVKSIEKSTVSKFFPPAKDI